MSTSELSTTLTQADREKRLVALSSVLAAIFLTSMKIVVGLLTHSLGILSEAAHSALDLVAAAVTYFAVRISGKPPDPDHTYGHGKIENLSALFETLLLLLTCVWIIYEAVQRLFFKHVEVQVSAWSFIVMAISIVVDFSRSRVLANVAKKYKSQALEADALHFSTDIWSSSVVIGGLALVVLSKWLHLAWLAKADAIAAMGVAGIVAYVSVQLGKRTINDLLDAVPPGLREEVMKAAKVAGVQSVRTVRIRRAGPEVFADISVSVNRDTVLERAHDIAAQVEDSIHKVLPGADVVVNLAPVPGDHEAMITKVRLLAARHDLGAHGIRVYQIDDRHSMELHLEVSDALTLEEAHAQVSDFEVALRQMFPDIQDVVTHIEPTGDASLTREGIPLNEARLMEVVKEVCEDNQVNCLPHDMKVHRVSGEISLSFHCIMNGDASITDAHAMAERLESALRAQVPSLGRVVIHVEPPEA